MKSVVFNSLLVVGTLISAPLWAQDDEGDFDEVAQEEAKLEVDSGDLKALSEARANKSDAGLIKAASRILGIDPKNLIALNTLALHYFEQQKYGMARIILQRALQDHADVAALHNNLGIVFLAEGKQRLAITSFRKSLELKSDYRIAAANLGAIFVEYQDYQRALSPLESGFRAVRSDLKSGSTQALEVANNYAVALMGVGEFDKAKDIFQEILGSASRNGLILLNYAILLVEKLKDYKEGGKIVSRIKFAVEDPKVLKRLEELESQVNANAK